MYNYITIPMYGLPLYPYAPLPLYPSHYANVQHTIVISLAILRFIIPFYVEKQKYHCILHIAQISDFIIKCAFESVCVYVCMLPTCRH